MSAPSWAVPGAKVVCIVPAHEWALSGVPYSTDVDEGRIFTIAKVLIDDEGWCGLGLWGYPLDEWYHVHGFRPLTKPSLEQDMEHFLPLLNTVGEGA